MNPRSSLDIVYSVYSREPLTWCGGLQDGKAKRETLFVIRFDVHIVLPGLGVG